MLIPSINQFTEPCVPEVGTLASKRLSLISANVGAMKSDKQKHVKKERQLTFIHF